MTTTDTRLPTIAAAIHPSAMLVTQPDAAVALGIKMSKFHKLKRAGIVETIQLGGRQMVTVASLRRITGQVAAD